MTAVTNVPADAPLADELADEDLVEMANLTEDDTGIPGTIFVSTRMGRHGPRVKYFDARAGEAQPSCSMTIADPPQVVANSLPDHVVRQRAPLVSAWVAINRDALLEFFLSRPIGLEKLCAVVLADDEATTLKTVQFNVDRHQLISGRTER